ncbi:hypothetical protein [Microbulbifer spongiae]|uniref:ASP external chaperone domain-containing protein n=1 Tax=Microbulbifer spongiae TaxID=2944933 RepID=A0ABY9E9Y5_9GAMM|nr:hypothetical protein [Microbulbifer sp. MI-G]WKD48314.1 hypothetical protein M8T91_10230 [Microbulbifer sp. MI-G]
MKLNTLMILTAALYLSGMAQASAVDNMEKNDIKVKPLGTISGARASSAEFGIFRVERSMASVPSSIAAPEQVVAIKGEMAIVNINADAATDIVAKGTIVRNTLTDELTTLTGNITVLLGKNVSASEVASVAGMEVLSEFPGTDIAILKVRESNDLLKALNAIQHSGLTLESRVEVTETMNKAQ